LRAPGAAPPRSTLSVITQGGGGGGGDDDPPVVNPAAAASSTAATYGAKKAQEDEEAVEAQCICLNDSFDVRSVAELCASCIQQSGDNGSGEFLIFPCQRRGMR